MHTIKAHAVKQVHVTNNAKTKKKPPTTTKSPKSKVGFETNKNIPTVSTALDCEI
jgi:hypothetical protein